MELSEIKIEIEKFKLSMSGKKRPRWPKKFRKILLSYHQEGHSILSLSRETGIPHQTIRKWTVSDKKPKPEKFKQVAVVSTHPSEQISSSIKLIWSEGFKIEGLGIDDLKVLLREGLL